MLWGALCAALLMAQPISPQVPQGSDIPKGHTYLPVVIEEDFATIMARDKQAKPEVMQRQRELLEPRYDLSG
jgi:hypothetical protein